MQQRFAPPHPMEDGFTCPHCRMYALLSVQMLGNDHEIRGRKCPNCNTFTLWYFNETTNKKSAEAWDLIFPLGGTAPEPNPDMPKDIKNDFDEARAILELSPRGAAALLRLCVQKLCVHAGEKGQNLNDDIGNLVQKGLPQTVQQALDAVRVVGNDSVHPGQMNLNDNREDAIVLLDLVNLITLRLISEPKLAQEAFEKLPENKKIAITNRDSPDSS